MAKKMTRRDIVAADVEATWKEISPNRSVKTEGGYNEAAKKLTIKTTGVNVGEYDPVYCGPSLRQRAINGYKSLQLSGPDGNGIETDTVDLISNLLHLVYQAGFDPEDVMRQAKMHFDAEVRGQL